MAPEVLQNESCEVNVDVFSFGIVLHELLSGELPYSDLASEYQVVLAVIGGRRPSLDVFSNFVAGVEICGVIGPCWHHPASRPSAGTLMKPIAHMMCIA